MKKLVLFASVAVIGLGAASLAHAGQVSPTSGATANWNGITVTEPKTDPTADEEAVHPVTTGRMAHVASTSDTSADDAASVSPSTGMKKVQRQDDKAYND